MRLRTKNLNKNDMAKAEEIYHRFVQYEWNEIGEGMKKSILDAINEALRQPPVSGRSELLSDSLEHQIKRENLDQKKQKMSF